MMNKTRKISLGRLELSLNKYQSYIPIEYIRGYYAGYKSQKPHTFKTNDIVLYFEPHERYMYDLNHNPQIVYILPFLEYIQNIIPKNAPYYDEKVLFYNYPYTKLENIKEI